MKKLLKISAIICLIAVIMSFNVSAADMPTNESYTYSAEQETVIAPPSYTLKNTITAETLGIEKLGGVSDICVYEDKLYVLEKTAGYIIVIDSNSSLAGIIGQDLNLKDPEGMFITEKGNIYVADTGNKRVLKLDNSGKLVNVINAPDSKKTLSKVDFKPVNIVADKGECLYIIVSDETNGIYQMDSNGNFMGFFGSVPVVPSIKELFWRAISTKEQLSRMLLFVPTEYKGIDIDEKGFIYTTVATNTASEIQSFIKSGGAQTQYAPIRKLNPKNIDVLIRNGSMPPAGDTVAVVSGTVNTASRFIDIAVRKDGVYSALDSTLSRVFTYDKNGNLLYIFGNENDNKGGFDTPNALCWWGEKIVVSDSGNNAIKVFSPTKYADIINKAITADAAGENEKAKDYWVELNKMYPESNLAIEGIGKYELRQGNYSKAMELFKKADNKEYYSKALKKQRQDIGYQMTGIAICVVVILGCFVFVYKIIKKKKGKPVKSKDENKLWSGFKYGFYIMRHPFDGFWDMQFENKGNVSSATLILGITTLLNLISSFATGYLVSGAQKTSWNILIQGVLSILLPFALWCVANWSVTSLMNGSGTFKHIYMYTAYSLTPFLIGTPLLVLLSHIFSLDEMAIYTIVNALIYIWVGFLIFAGTLVIHQYEAFKTIGMILIIIVAMGIIVFLFLLCVTILQQVTDFIKLIIEEINLRI